MRWPRRSSLALALLLCVAPAAWGAVALDTVNDSTLSGGASHASTTTTVSVTVNTGSNGATRVLVVYVGLDAPGTTTVSSISGAGATWQSTATFTFAGTSPTSRGELWYGINPTVAASQTVTITLTASNASDIYAIVWSLNGVDQTTPLAGLQTKNATAASDTVTVTSAVGDLVVYGSPSLTAFINPTAGCNTVEMDPAGSTAHTSGVFNDFWGGAHCAGAATVSIGYKSASTGGVSMMAADVQAAAAGTATPARTLTGVGL